MTKPLTALRPAHPDLAFFPSAGAFPPDTPSLASLPSLMPKNSVFEPAAEPSAASSPEPMLSDADWAVVKAALDRTRSGTGRPFAAERQTLEAVIWRHRMNGRWREVPPAYGPWWRAAQLHYRWVRTGQWAKLEEALAQAGRGDLAALFATPVVEGEE